MLQSKPDTLDSSKQQRWLRESQAEPLFDDHSFEEPQKVLASRISRVQVPINKVMNKVPDHLLQRIFRENKEYLPLAMIQKAPAIKSQLNFRSMSSSA